MEFIQGKDIQDALRKVVPSSIAVAYVGSDWARYVDVSQLKEIVLSPTIGTNPFAVLGIADQLGWDNVYFLDNLHSKIYLGATLAAVGSFNLTANGLSAAGLEEAGFVVQDPHVIASIRCLLESYKASARREYPTKQSKLARVAKLRELWDRAIKVRLIRNDAVSTDFSAWRPAAPDEIYVCCSWGTATYDEDIVHPSTVEAALAFAEEDGVQPDRWILCWRATGEGRPYKSSNPYWLHIDEVIPHGAVDDRYSKLAVQRNDRDELPPPFELTRPVVQALWTVLESDRFPQFLGVHPWSLADTLPELPAFFDALRAAVTEGATVTRTRANRGRMP